MYGRINKTVVDVRRFPLFSKLLPFVVMALLLSLPLAKVTVDSIGTSCDDTSVEVSLQVNDNGTPEYHFLNPTPELSFNADLAPAEGLSLPGGRLQSSVKPALAVLSLKDIVSEVYIPPEIVS